MTILALSSGSGISGVAVIRVSGSEAKNILKLITKKKLPQPRRATLLELNNINTSELIDEAIVLWFPGPNSYTGEDMVEFHVHGSKSVILELQNTILNTKKCRIADPGEFTKLAFINGKINLLKAEGIGDLIASETEIQKKQALNIIKGKSHHKFNELREKLLKILSHVEAKIDFPDEDLSEDILNTIKNNTLKVENEIIKILEDDKVGQQIREGYKIAIVGPTNSGKSSLINYFAKKEIAIVSEIAGTTRDVLETHLNFDGYPVIISDTAGIRESKDIIEKEGIKLALNKAEKADLRLVVIEPKNLNFLGFLKDLFDENSILIINKSDLYKIEIPEQIKKLRHVVISIKKETNIDKLIFEIKKNLSKSFMKSNNVFITRVRHRKNLEECLLNLKNFRSKNDEEDFDKAAEDLRLATRNLGSIVGKVDVEEILASIFNDFCIGK